VRNFLCFVRCGSVCVLGFVLVSEAVLGLVKRVFCVTFYEL